MARKIVLFDTSVLINYFRKKNKEKTILFELANSDLKLAVSSITIFEIFLGSNQDQVEFWQSIFSEFKVLDFDFNVAQHAAVINKELKLKNKQLAIPDLFIGANAIYNKLPLVTLNTKHFSRISNINLFEPTS